MTTTHRRRHRLTRIALVTAIAIFSTGGYLSASDVNVRLREVARDGDLASIEYFLDDRGADIDTRDDGYTALMWASRNVHDKVAAVLRAWAAKPGIRQDTRPTLVQSQEPAPAAQVPRPGTPPPVEQNKTALLIANAGCDHFPKLRTPIQEARPSFTTAATGCR